ncbi:hypothetical protein VTK56DRAFT_2112 [Thermocarpiscus australiensis]
MGNAQSNEAPRRSSQKLSKPKTGTHATAGLLSPVGLLNGARPISHTPLPVPLPSSPALVSTPTTYSAVEESGVLDQRVESDTPVYLTPKLPKESKRRSLLRSWSSRDAADPVRRNRSVGPGPAPGLVNTPTRTSSMTYEPAAAHYGQAAPDNRPAQHATRTPWDYSPASYEANRLLDLAEEPAREQAAAMSEDNMTTLPETTWKTSDSGNPPSATVTRTSSDVSLYIPVRRRSVIQTPGVATRSSSGRDTPTAPKLNFRLSHPPTPSLSRQQSSESYRGGVLSMPLGVHDPNSAPRVVTPCEEKYQSIGAFKLGSLRITNGSPSPVSAEVVKSGDEELGVSDGTAHDGYFDRAEAPETGITAGTAAQHVVGSSEILPRVGEPQPQPVKRLGAASAVAGSEFLPEISQSPLFSVDQSQSTSPTLQTTSKITAVEDRLFDDESQPEYSSIEVLDVRSDPNAKPPQSQIKHDTGKTFTRTDSGFISSASPSSDVPSKPLSKADSGYSSNVSLRSFQAKAKAPENHVAASSQPSKSASHRDAPVGPKKDSSSSQTEALYPAEPGRDAPPPPVPPKNSPRSAPDTKPRLNSIPSKTLFIHNMEKRRSSARTNTPKKTRLVPAPVINLQSSDRGPVSPESLSRTPGSAKSSRSENSGSALSIGSGSQKPSRLQRLLSGAHRQAAGPPTVHATHELEQSIIPPVPREVEDKLQEHTGRFPTSAKRLALKPRSSMDTLKTIFSVGSIEASLEAVNAVQTAPPVPETETKEALWRQTLQSVPSSIANAAAHVMARKPISRKPVPARQESGKGKDQEATEQPRQNSGLPHVDMAPRTAAAKSSHGNSLRNVASTSIFDASAVPISPETGGRTMSLTLPGERVRNLRNPAPGRDAANSNAGSPSPSLPSPVAKGMSVQSNPRTPSRVKPNRKPLALSVPPPLGSKESRESIQRYPASQPLSRRTSTDSTLSYSSGQPGMAGSSRYPTSPSGVTMDPRRLMSFRKFQDSQSLQYQHVTGASRRSSVSSVQSHDGHGIQRPISAQGWQVQTAQQPLRHRSSYDGYSYQQRRPHYGYPPSMSNGYTAPPKLAYEPRNRGQPDAAATWSRSQLDATAGQWYQDGRYLQYASRGHYRSHSMGNRSNGHVPNPPYRVLHSYNSPAYRNAPIWG